MMGATRHTGSRPDAHREQQERDHTVQQSTSLRRHPHTGAILRPIYVSPKTGRVFWPILGAAEPDDTPNPDDEPDKDRTFTQAEVAAIMTREKNQGKRAGQRELVESLGFEKLEDAQAFITAQREAEDAAKTEAQKLADQAAKDRRDAEAAKAEVAQERRTTAIERALVRAKVGDDDLDDATLLLSRDLDDDADADAITAATTALKERRPELFTSSGAEDPKARRRGEMPKGRPGTPKKPEGAKRGAGGLAAAKRRGYLKDDED